MRGVPRATYRLQLHGDFTLADAARIADYLHELGVSHVYTSPILQAERGSSHGYDVVDPSRVSKELGGREGLERFHATLQESCLGHVLDVVPNHMSVGSSENRWWWDVLEKGPASPYAAYFDIDWDAPGSSGKVVLPILGGPLEEALAEGSIRLMRSNNRACVEYHEHLCPVAPGTLGDLPADLPRINADPTLLEAVLDRQNYRLVHWREATEIINYRRFFEVDSLAGLRVDKEEVFNATHELVLDLTREGGVQGLRIDHPDGLRDPEGYLRRLEEAAPEAWVIVEKILHPGERLPGTWPAAGTTGYDFLNLVGGLLIDPRGEAALNGLYTGFTGTTLDYAELARKKKLQVLRELLASDLNRIARLLLAIFAHNDRILETTRDDLKDVLMETAASFPVYRTYVDAEAGRVTDADRVIIIGAAEDAKKRRPDLDPRLFEFVKDRLLLMIRGRAESDFVMRFQQLTGPVAAKGIEDTAFYSYNRFIALNEVGGDPSRFGVGLEEFHQAMVDARKTRPHSMLATSTHDTKRSEDVRARLALLSEIPEMWSKAVREWSQQCEKHRMKDLPDRNAEYHFYQILVGAWPICRERMDAYMLKAVREAKAHTSWIDPDPEYEDILRSFVNAVMTDADFMDRLETFVEPLVNPGRINSLAQTLIKLTAPGVPDIYQGAELWDLSLVDPDNRRPVDYDLRRRLLVELRDASVETVLAGVDEGLPKLWVIHRALSLRKSHPRVFSEGTYTPVAASGSKSAHVVAFRRGEELLTIVPRWPLTLVDWEDTALEVPMGVWLNVLTGDIVRDGSQLLASLLATFPVALLSRVDQQSAA